MSDCHHCDNIELTSLAQTMSSDEETSTEIDSESEQEIEHPLEKKKDKPQDKPKKHKRKSKAKKKKSKEKITEKETRPTIDISALAIGDWIDYATTSNKIVKNVQFKSIENENGTPMLLLKKGKRLWLVDKTKIECCYRSSPPPAVVEKQKQAKTADTVAKLLEKVAE